MYHFHDHFLSYTWGLKTRSCGITKQNRLPYLFEWKAGDKLLAIRHAHKLPYTASERTHSPLAVHRLQLFASEVFSQDNCVDTQIKVVQLKDSLFFCNTRTQKTTAMQHGKVSNAENVFHSTTLLWNNLWTAHFSKNLLRLLDEIHYTA